MKKQTEKVTLTRSEGKKELKPFCEAAKLAADKKARADELRPQAAEYLKTKLDSDPDTKDFTGTVVCLFDEQMYKIRVQRPTKKVNWREKRLQDPNLSEYKELMNKIDKLQSEAKGLETQLEAAHPKCVTRDFSIAFMGMCEND